MKLPPLWVTPRALINCGILQFNCRVNLQDSDSSADEYEFDNQEKATYGINSNEASTSLKAMSKSGNKDSINNLGLCVGISSGEEQENVVAEGVVVEDLVEVRSCCVVERFLLK